MMTHQALRSPRIPWIYKVSCRLRCKDRSIIGSRARSCPLASSDKIDASKRRECGKLPKIMPRAISLRRLHWVCHGEFAGGQMRGAHVAWS